MTDTTTTSLPYISGFPPVAKGTPSILILGSMPGGKSLEMQQYYAHPANLFWPFMQDIVGIKQEDAYSTRTRQLTESRIALWDVLKSCQRHGSLDSKIRTDSQTANDFVTFFKQFPTIKNVFFNGRKAEQVFQRFVVKNFAEDLPALNYCWLPSTSPANASIKREEKLQQWRKILVTSKSGTDLR